MRNIDKYLAIAESKYWTTYVSEFEDGRGIDIDFSINTSVGQDFHMNIGIDEDNPTQLMEQIYKYWHDFDPEEEAMAWIDPVTGKGTNGAPESILDIVKDMKEAKDEILELYKLMDGKVWNIRDTKIFNENYNYALKELLEANSDDESPETVRLIANYELKDNYYGNCFILLGRKRIEVESIYTEGDNAMVHLSCEAFEGDINMTNLSTANTKRVMKFLRHVYKNKLKDNNYK